jgi:hypothetical protein
MTFHIVERVYENPVTDEELNESSAMLEPCLKARNIKWVQTYVAKDRKRCLCIFEAPDSETVRTSFRTANVKFERVWAAFAPWA